MPHVGEVAVLGDRNRDTRAGLRNEAPIAGPPGTRVVVRQIGMFRHINGERFGARFDLARIRAGRDPDPQILPGDVVVVGYSPMRQLYLDVLKAAPLFNVFTRY